MGDDLGARITELSDLVGPSGDEGDVREWLERRWQPHFDSRLVDGAGGALFLRDAGPPYRALAVHIDEVGHTVVRIDDGGLLWLRRGPGPPGARPHVRYPFGHRALVIGPSRRVEGVYATVTGHVASMDEAPEPECWVDVGASCADEARALGAEVGAGVVPIVAARRSGDRVIGKAMDDRAMLAIVDSIVRGERGLGSEHSLAVLATVQEEVGTVGAATLARHLPRGTEIVVLDVAPTNDVPGAVADSDVRLKAGPVLIARDDGGHYSRGLAAALSGASTGPVQHATYRHYATDARELVKQGFEVAVVGLPTRYTHSVYETVCLADAVATEQMLRDWLAG
jgi:endoglucanase